MDFITRLPLSHGYSTIMVIVDRLSKFAYFTPLKNEFTSKIVAKTFINSVVKIHGFPKTIVSDQDRVFISSFWQQLFKAQGTTLAMSSSYHPQSHGEMENLNKTLEMYLRCFAFDNPNLVFGWSISTILRNWNTLYLNCLQLNPLHFLNNLFEWEEFQIPPFFRVFEFF